MVKGSQILLVLGFVALIVTLVIYSRPQATPSLEKRVYTIAILPEEDEEALRRRYDPLVKYLSTSLERPFQLIIPDDYNQLLKLFGEGEIDLAFFGGFTFLKANQDFGATPLVMRDTDLRFHSHFISKRQASHKHISDFKGAKLSFGSRLSTSGHLMPRFFLEEQQITPETYFASVEYSGAHDKTAFQVLEGNVDIGAINSEILEDMFEDGRLDRDTIDIIWTTPKFPDYVWTVKRTASQDFKHRVTSAFLTLDPLDNSHQTILDGAQAVGFLPASIKDFDQLFKVATSMGML